MIPYFEIPSIPLFGPFQIHPFGVLVATSVLVAGSLIVRFGLEQGQDEEELRGAITWGIVWGFIGAHLMAVLIYFPERIGEEGIIVLFKIWDGISSFGGFFGAFFGLWVYYKRLGKPWLHHADIIIQAFAIAWVFGRAACFVAFDHPGNETDFFLGQMYRDGVVRHNLGFYEMLWVMVAVWPCVFITRRLKPRPGVMCLAVCASYAPGRFFFDSLRGIDKATENSTTRLMGLTPGQLSAVAILILGIMAFKRGRNWTERVAAAEALKATPTKVAPIRSKRKASKKKKR